MPTNAPQLHLSLPTSRFKRSFEQFGFDLDSPVSSSAGISEEESNKRVRSQYVDDAVNEDGENSGSSSRSSISGSGTNSNRNGGSSSEPAPMLSVSIPTASLEPPPRLPTPVIDIDIDMAIEEESYPVEERELDEDRSGYMITEADEIAERIHTPPPVLPPLAFGAHEVVREAEWSDIPNFDNDEPTNQYPHNSLPGPRVFVRAPPLVQTTTRAYGSTRAGASNALVSETTAELRRRERIDADWRAVLDGARSSLFGRENEEVHPPFRRTLLLNSRYQRVHEILSFDQREQEEEQPPTIPLPDLGDPLDAYAPGPFRNTIERMDQSRPIRIQQGPRSNRINTDILNDQRQYWERRRPSPPSLFSSIPPTGVLNTSSRSNGPPSSYEAFRTRRGLNTRADPPPLPLPLTNHLPLPNPISSSLLSVFGSSLDRHMPDLDRSTERRPERARQPSRERERLIRTSATPPPSSYESLLHARELHSQNTRSDPFSTRLAIERERERDALIGRYRESARQRRRDLERDAEREIESILGPTFPDDSQSQRESSLDVQRQRVMEVQRRAARMYYERNASAAALTPTQRDTEDVTPFRPFRETEPRFGQTSPPHSASASHAPLSAVFHAPSLQPAWRREFDSLASSRLPQTRAASRAERERDIGRQEMWTRREGQNMGFREYINTLRIATGFSDYVRDEDFDDSYEGLLSLAATLGDVRERPRATSEEVIKGLQEGVYKDFKHKFNEGRETESDTGKERCPICLDDYELLDPVLKLSRCSHWLHKVCLERWLSTANTCPVCREWVEAPDTTPSSATPYFIVHPEPSLQAMVRFRERERQQRLERERIDSERVHARRLYLDAERERLGLRRDEDDDIRTWGAGFTPPPREVREQERRNRLRMWRLDRERNREQTVDAEVDGDDDTLGWRFLP